MAHEVTWTESALADLLDAVEYVARDSPSYAATLAVRAERAAASLVELPHRGRHVREFNDSNVRELIVGRSYRLIYRVDAAALTVIAFVHTARDLASLIGDTAQ